MSLCNHTLKRGRGGGEERKREHVRKIRNGGLENAYEFKWEKGRWIDRYD